MAQFEIYDTDGTQLMSMDNMLLVYPYEVEPHTHPRLELSFIKSGTGIYEIGECSYELKKGDVVLINNVEAHRIILRPGEHLLNSVIHFYPQMLWNAFRRDMDYRFLQAFFERSNNFSHVLNRQNPATATIYRLMEEIEEEFIELKNCYDLMIKIKLQNVLVNVIRYYDYCQWSDNENIPNRDLQMMSKVITYIKEHLSEKITLEDLGRVSNMSPNYFSVLFKKYNGMTPFEYISTQRIYLAITMIHQSDRTLTDIAMCCGFNSTSAFAKAFRRVTGNTPSYYRAK